MPCRLRSLSAVTWTDALRTTVPATVVQQYVRLNDMMIRWYRGRYSGMVVQR